MSETVIAKRYAKALLNLAEKNQVLEEVAEHLSDVAAVYSGSSDLQKVIVDTKISTTDKLSVLKNILEKLELNPLVNTFTQFLLSKKRLPILPHIEAVFSKLVQEKLGWVDAEVTVAKKLTKAETTALTKKLSEYSGKQVHVNVNVDESILGGVVTKIGSVVIDGSLRNQLTLVYQSIIRG